MLMTRQNYQNTRDTIVMPNDPLEMDLVLVDYQGFPIDLTGKDLLLTIKAFMGGWHTSASNIGSEGYNTEASASIVVNNAAKGQVTIATVGNLLNMYGGYRYAIQIKDPLADQSEYKTIAKGNIEVFNQ